MASSSETNTTAKFSGPKSSRTSKRLGFPKPPSGRRRAVSEELKRANLRQAIDYIFANAKAMLDDEADEDMLLRVAYAANAQLAAWDRRAGEFVTEQEARRFEDLRADRDAWRNEAEGYRDLFKMAVRNFAAMRAASGGSATESAEESVQRVRHLVAAAPGNRRSRESRAGEGALIAECAQLLGAEPRPDAALRTLVEWKVRECNEAEAERDALAAEVEELRADLDDYRDGLRRVAEERTHGDEVHCACVPHYRELLRDRTEDVVRATKAIDALAARVEELEGVLKRIAAITPKPEHGPEYVAGQIGGITTAADQAIGKP